MKRVSTIEEAIHEGYNFKKVVQMAKKELGDNATRREIVKKIEDEKKKKK